MKESKNLKISDYMQQKLRLLYIGAVRDVAIIVTCCHIVLYLTGTP